MGTSWQEIYAQRTAEREAHENRMLDAINERFNLSLARTCSGSMGAVFARDERGFWYVVVHTDNNVRGVIRQRRRGAGYTYLHNGQVGSKGMQVLGPWNEGSFVVE